MLTASIIISILAIAISGTSLVLGIRRNYQHGVDWRFRPIADADVPEYLDWRPYVGRQPDLLHESGTRVAGEIERRKRGEAS